MLFLNKFFFSGEQWRISLFHLILQIMEPFTFITITTGGRHLFLLTVTYEFSKNKENLKINFSCDGIKRLSFKCIEVSLENYGAVRVSNISSEVL